jgi:branched-chain amino acid aminotransferase
MTNIFYVNGDYVPESDAKLPVRDLAILRGYGVFDYLRTYGGQPFRLDKNIERFRRSAELLELQFPWSNDDLRQIVLETVKRNAGNAEDFSIRLVVTGGISSSNITPDGDPSLIVYVQPFTPYPATCYTDGVKVITVPNQRLIPDAKSIMYTPAILAQRRAKEQGGMEAIYRTPDDHILEATTSNVFLFQDETLITTPTNGAILPGITRMTVLELAEAAFTVVVRPVTYDDLISADEAFLSSANKEVMPIVQVDDHRIGTGTPGTHTRDLMARFDALKTHVTTQVN